MDAAPPTADVTRLLARWRAGDRAATDALGVAIYPMLRELARQQLRRSPTHTLRTTDLAHEAYERLALAEGLQFQDRQHFLAVASNVVRRVVVDHARRRTAEKRGGDQLHVSLDEITGGSFVLDADPTDWLALDAALSALQQADPAIAQVVELRVFGGLEVAEIAAVCGSSTATVGRQWRFARAWIADHLQRPGATPAA